MANFREMRTRAGIGLAEAAEHFGISRQAVNAWERGEAMPRAELLPEIAQYYGCAIEDLLSDREDT